jgi:hypothetical protein
MKQFLSLSLFLFPCLAWAQYPSNGNQKITLGEQTTANGLIYRGVAADTTLTAKSDTAAYFVLDTVNINLYTYKASATGRKWRQLGADTASIAYVNTYGDQTVNGAKTFTSAVTATRFNPTANTVTGTGMYLPAANTLALSTDGTKRLEISSTGLTTFSINSGVYTALNATSPNTSVYYRLTPTGGDAYLFGAGVQQTDDFGIYNLTRDKQFLTILGGASGGFVGIDLVTPEEKLDVNGNARFRSVGAGAFSNNLNITSNGTLTTATSDEKFKYNINPIKYGLSTILQLNPVNFQWIKGEENDLGFIAQDVAEIIPEAVDTNWNSDLLMRYESIIPILTKAIQEQQALIKALEQRIINLENK